MDVNSVIIIEDDRLQAMVAERILIRAGYEVAGKYPRAEDGYEAVHRLRPDIILADNQLAGEMDGLDLIRKLRGEGNLTPVIFLTGESIPEQEILTELTGVICLLKPVIPGVLVESVSHVTDRLSGKKA